MARAMRARESGQEGQSADSLIRAVLRKTAHTHYSRQSGERREEVRRSFYKLDESGDGRISLEEFLESTEEVIRKGSGRVIAKIFSYVDEDRSGFLEFDEFLVFTFIMEAGFQLCDACLAPVIIAGYTCKTCWTQRGHETHDTFDLCSSCYTSDAFDHPASHELVDTCRMYHFLLTTSFPSEDCTKKEDQVQCCICEEYHTKNIRSLLVEGNNHVVELEGSSPQQFVCEWCASYMCTGCGKYFSEASYHDVQTNQWLRRDLCCGVCNKQENYQPHVDSLLELLEGSEIPEKCSTCAKNLQNGTLRSGKEAKSSSSSEEEEATSSISSNYTDLITAQMANNLLLQQSYFNARMMASMGAALSYLA